MTSRGISIDMLQKAVEANNRNGGAGRLTEGEEVLLVRLTARCARSTTSAISLLELAMARWSCVADVAEVRIGSITRYGAVTRNGEDEAVQGLVLGLRGANARDVAQGVRAKLDELAPTLPKDVKIRVFYDRGDLVSRAGRHGVSLSA